jgi:hypothetical protein
MYNTSWVAKPKTEVTMMVRVASLFSQLLSLIPRPTFQQLVAKHGAEKGAKGLTCWAHFTAMLFCQFAQAKSLREITGGLRCCLGKLMHLNLVKAPPKSTLGYANAHRPWRLFEDLFYTVLGQAQRFAPAKKFRFKNKLLSLDATVIDLCLSLFPWAKFRRTKGAVKLHLLLDHDGYLPTFAHLTGGKVHEVKIARQLLLSPESIVAMDRAYNDYELFASWTRQRVWFVTRLKQNARYQVVDDWPLPQCPAILADQVIRLTGVNAQRKCPHDLRRVVVWDEVNQRELELLTNHLEFGPTTIAAIYRERWQIELFFKAIKQNLRIKTFVGTSENALRIQIWTALLAMLLRKICQFRSQWPWSLSNLVALLRWNLFTYRELWAWLDHPFETPPLGPEIDQLLLPLPGLGQQARFETNHLVRKPVKPVQKTP